MKVFVTGGTGQLGSEVVRQLVSRGDHVVALVRDNGRARLLDGVDCERIEGDVTRPETLKVSGCEAVFHLAGVVSYWQRGRARMDRVNVEGTRAGLEAAAAAGVARFGLTSSIAALGHVEGDGEGDEDTAFNWERFNLGYQETKRASEALVLAETRMETVSVLPGIVFGARDVHQNGGRMLLQVAQGIPGVPCGATTAANLTDVAAGHLLALDRGRPGRRYVLGGTTATFSALFAKVAKVLEAEAPTRIFGEGVLLANGLLSELAGLVTGKEPAFTRQLARVSTRNRRYSSDRAVQELGYAPGPLEIGIEACREWYRAEGIL